MFKKALSEKLARIFDLKVTFDKPGESEEQECIFVEIDASKNRITNGLEIARVEGKIILFGNSAKLPFGYLSKRLHHAQLSDTREFFFHGFEENKETFGNIAEKSASFVYMHSGEYDPAHGTLNELNTSYGENL